MSFHALTALGAPSMSPLGSSPQVATGQTRAGAYLTANELASPRRLRGPHDPWHRREVVALVFDVRAGRLFRFHPKEDAPT